MWHMPKRGTPSRTRAPEGVVRRHRRHCATARGDTCDCAPGYQAQVWSAAERRTIRKTFSTLGEARAWRAEAKSALRHGTMQAPTRTTLAEAAAEWLAAAQAGIVGTRSGERYKPSSLRAYEQALRTRLLPGLGHLRLSAVTRSAIQDLVDRLMAEGLAPSTVRNAVLPLRAIYRRAHLRSQVVMNPTLGLLLPAVRGRRDRIARPAEARALLEALPESERALWAAALYAGLRRGELQALRWQDIDFAHGLIRVERGWDPKVGPIAPKSRAGRRRVPLAHPLRAYLAAHRLLSTQTSEESLVFGHDRVAFSAATVRRAQAAWRRAVLEPIGLHECRHTYAAFMTAAGVNAKALSSYMGHSSITVTLDRYGHLMPGNEAEAAGMLSQYLESDSALGAGANSC
jgi:integrase